MLCAGKPSVPPVSPSTAESVFPLQSRGLFVFYINPASPGCDRWTTIHRWSYFSCHHESGCGSETDLTGRPHAGRAARLAVVSGPHNTYVQHPLEHSHKCDSGSVVRVPGAVRHDVSLNARSHEQDGEIVVLLAAPACPDVLLPVWVPHHCDSSAHSHIACLAVYRLCFITHRHLETVQRLTDTYVVTEP